jgi:hypothetical protein
MFSLCGFSFGHGESLLASLGRRAISGRWGVGQGVWVGNSNCAPLTYVPLTYTKWFVTSLQTVIELDTFVKRAKAIMSDDERTNLVNFLAANPEAGTALGGGLRKVRIPRTGKGKSGGYRTIYVFGGRHMPLILVTVFAKNEKDNLSTTELADAVKLSKALIANYGTTTHGDPQ